jgi:hypothetical protein
MNVPVSFYRNSIVVDEYGSQNKQIAFYKKAFCTVKYIGTPSAGASEEFINDQKTGKVKVELAMRFFPGLDFDDIFEMEGATFNIYSIHIVGRQKFLTIRGESRDDESQVVGKYHSDYSFARIFDTLELPGVSQSATFTYDEFGGADFSVPVYCNTVKLYRDGLMISSGVVSGEAVQVGGVTFYKVKPGVGDDPFEFEFTTPQNEPFREGELVVDPSTNLILYYGPHYKVRLMLRHGDVTTEYDQEITLDIGNVSWRFANTTVDIEPAMKSSSHLNYNYARLNDHQDYSFSMKYPELYMTSNGPLKYRRTSTSITKVGSGSVVNDAGIAYGDKLIVKKISEAGEYELSFRATFKDPLAAGFNESADSRVFVLRLTVV